MLTARKFGEVSAVSTQQTVWGNIDWFDPENPVEQVYSRAGLESVEGHSYQRPHTHYDEQIIHVISGHGRHWISDVCYAMSPGRTFYIPAGEQHELINDGDQPLRYMLLSTVSSPREDASAFIGRDIDTS